MVTALIQYLVPDIYLQFDGICLWERLKLCPWGHSCPEAEEGVSVLPGFTG